MPPPAPPTLDDTGCTTNTSPSAPRPSPSAAPPDALMLKLKNVLNVAPGPSGMRVVENAEPDWPNVAGVTRSTPPVQAALPFSCNGAQLLKFVKLNTVAACAVAEPSAATTNAAAQARQYPIILASPKTVRTRFERAAEPYLVRGMMSNARLCRLCDHQIEDDHQRAERRHAEDRPDAEVERESFRKGRLVSGGRDREVAHAPLQPDDRQPARAGEQEQHDRPREPARVKRKSRVPREIEAGRRLEHHRSRREQPVGDDEQSQHDGDRARIAGAADEVRIEGRAEARAEEQRRGQHVQPFDDQIVVHRAASFTASAAWHTERRPRAIARCRVLRALASPTALMRAPRAR